MEGIPAWWFFAIFFIYGWMILSAVPVLVAIGLLIADRRQAARVWFAAGLFSEALAWASFCIVVGAGLGLAMPILGLSLALCGTAQLVAALRNTRTYGRTLSLAVLAVLVIASGTPMRYRVIEWLHLPEALHKLPEWHSLPVALSSLALACAALFFALYRRPATTASMESRNVDSGFTARRGG